MDKQGICDKWLDRIGNAMEVQKETCEEFINMRFSRRDLIELRLIISVLRDSEE